jgi:transcriptional regulator with XRE-family HTH domain
VKKDQKYLRLLKRISANLKKIRVKRDLTQEEMAEKTDFSYRFYQRLESGTYQFSLHTLHKLAEKLRVDIRILFD